MEIKQHKGKRAHLRDEFIKWKCHWCFCTESFWGLAQQMEN